MLPIGHDAEALEALALDADVFFGVFMAGGAEIRHAHGLVVELLLLDDGRLDGHTMVIPAGDIGRPVAAHGVGAHDEILEGLVEGVAHVDVAVGEGRAVVQGETGLALVLLEHLMIDVLLLPAAEHFRLTLGQTGPHGKIGFREV